MTIVICQKHGSHPGINVCDHLSDPPRTEIESLGNALKVNFTHNGSIEFENYLCRACTDSIGIEDGEKLELGEPKAEAAYSLASNIVCRYCLDSLMKNA